MSVPGRKFREIIKYIDFELEITITIYGNGF